MIESISSEATLGDSVGILAVRLLFADFKY